MTALLLANAGEVFPDGVQTSGGLWQKAVIASDTSGTMLISPNVPPNLHPSLEGAWAEPAECVVPSAPSGRLCRDLLADELAWRRVLAHAEHGPVSLDFQVFSPGVSRVVERLQVEGVEVVGGMPSCSPATVAFWNTKVGAHGLLSGVSELASARPAATISTYEAAMAIAATAGESDGFVLKPNYGLGGAGIRVLPRAGKWEPSRETVKAKVSVAAGEEEPYLLEALVGEIGRNQSLTADFAVPATGEVRFLGIAEQILPDGVSYSGCQSSPDLVAPDVREKALRLGRVLATALQRRGYAGMVNADFIVTPESVVYVAEFNLRHSAPLDQFLLARRLHGPDWAQRCSFRCEEDVPLPAACLEFADLAPHATSVLGRGHEAVVVPLTLNTDKSGVGRAGYVAFAPNLDEAGGALSALREAV